MGQGSLKFFFSVISLLVQLAKMVDATLHMRAHSRMAQFVHITQVVQCFMKVSNSGPAVKRELQTSTHFLVSLDAQLALISGLRK